MASQKEKDVPVERCDQKKKDLEDLGYKVISCDPKKDDPDMCKIVYRKR